MTSPRLLLAGLLVPVGLGLVALTPTALYACSCAAAGPRQLVDHADAVFVGTLAEIEVPPADGDAVVSSTDPVTYHFDVDRVLEGGVGATVDVASVRSGASCGLEGMREGREYVVFATTTGPALEAGLCGGTRPADAAFVAQVERRTGPARPPAPDLDAIVAAIVAFVGFGS
ncbi:hypothetical protein [Nocardioides sp. YIM 152315]|uniref:hypothetical protein n=1 Tax=Nocardioides sp. YIM 152315 TaxID=3031760 RepID=UPI0023DBA27F|nr:hypothetical protein [Nocardioides sp. YIM 152315]MDF1605043.1 hypothetical protein [Nocardioides sp. YIM 152315]